MPGEAVVIVLAAGSGNWHTQSIQFLRLVVLCSAVKQRLVYRTRARAVGVTDCRINDTDASLCIRLHEHVSRVRVCPASAVSELLTVLKWRTLSMLNKKLEMRRIEPL